MLCQLIRMFGLSHDWTEQMTHNFHNILVVSKSRSQVSVIENLLLNGLSDLPVKNGFCFLNNHASACAGAYRRGEGVENAYISFHFDGRRVSEDYFVSITITSRNAVQSCLSGHNRRCCIVMRQCHIWWKSEIFRRVANIQSLISHRQKNKRFLCKTSSILELIHFRCHL